MTASIAEIPLRCFDGVIPSAVATCDAEGVPNATWLSQIAKVDDRHIAFSCQFFRKTRVNLASDPRAQVLIVDPTTGRQWRLDVRFLRSEHEGRTFEAMRSRIAAIASLAPIPDVFALRSADVFEVLTVARVEVDVELAEPTSSGARGDVVEGLSRISSAIASHDDLGSLVDAGLEVLTGELGYENVGLYLLEPSESTLYAFASRGFRESGVGARIDLGIGVVGTCAAHRLPIRIVDLARELRYERAVVEQAQRRASGAEREIPLPGLDGAQSHLAVPLVVGGALFGVLSVESTRLLAFDESDVRVLSTAGQLLAQAVALHREDEVERDVVAAEGAEPRGNDIVRVRYYEADDSVFVDGEYLIKGLPGRILYLVLSLRDAENRSTFLNRELRLHPYLKLPSYKDNLETRLLMLQRRLDEKALPVRLSRAERGRLRIDCEKRIEIERVPIP